MTERVADLSLNWDFTEWRNYDPVLGRFHQVDELADIFSSITPYNYSLNNPVNFADPTGLCPECEEYYRKNNLTAQEGMQYVSSGDALYTYRNGSWEREGGELPEVTITPESGSDNSSAATFMAGTLLVAGTTSQLDTPLPGPMDVAAVGVVIGGSIIAGGMYLYDSFSDSKPVAVPIDVAVHEKDNLNFTAIGKMEDLKKFDAIPNIDTWRKTGRKPGPGEPQVTWSENKLWLQERIDRGDKFIIATDPSTLPPVMGGYIPGTPNGYFTARELDYLMKQGIIPIPGYEKK
jgi:RHS repeat-associated protein